MAGNPLAPFTCSDAASVPFPATSWSTVKAIFESPVSLRFEVGYPANLRLTLTVSGVPMSARGVEDVGQLIEGFQLGGEAMVSCERAVFSLVQVGDVVLYRDALTKVSIPRGAYDRLAALVTELVGDPRVDAAFQATYLQLAQEARAAAWGPGCREQ